MGLAYFSNRVTVVLDKFKRYKEDVVDEVARLVKISLGMGHYLEGGDGANGGRPCSFSRVPPLCGAHFLLTLPLYLPLYNKAP